MLASTVQFSRYGQRHRLLTAFLANGEPFDDRCADLGTCGALASASGRRLVCPQGGFRPLRTQQRAYALVDAKADLPSVNRRTDSLSRESRELVSDSPMSSADDEHDGMHIHCRLWTAPPGRQVLLRKEVIQPHLPVRLPCYDFVPIANPTFDSSLPCGLGHWLRVLPTFVT